MRSSLRRLTIAPLLGLATAAVLAGVGWYALNRDKPSAEVASSGTAPVSTTYKQLDDNPRRDVAGNAVLADAIVSLERYAHISALVQQHAHFGALEIIGEGSYHQQGRGEQRQIKWVLRTQLGDESASLVQLVDDRFLWIDKRLPTTRRVDRVDLWRLRRLTAGKELPPIAPGQAVFADGGLNAWQNFGGLPMLLEAMSRSFDFAAPRQVQYGNEQVYALRGVWKPEKLRELLGVPQVDDNQAASIEIPQRVPLDVLVFLGSRDYFPFMIQYRGADDPSIAADAPISRTYQESDRPLMRIKLYQVSFAAPINPNEFVFTMPSGVDWFDATPRYIERLGEAMNDKR
ncbi:MAG: hypothetical protein WD851_14955 [Pirellulales bacterium]